MRARFELRSRAMALAVVMQVTALVLVIAAAFLMTADTNLNFVRQERRSLQALYTADAGAQVVLKNIYDRLDFMFSTGTFPADVFDGITTTGTVTGASGETCGDYTVTCTVAPPSGQPPTAWTWAIPDFLLFKTVTLTSKGTFAGLTRTVIVTAKVGFKPANAFNFACYTNNYWWASSSLPDIWTVNGNLGANGNCDLLGGASAMVNGSPTYGPDGQVLSMAGVSAALGIHSGGSYGTGSWMGYGATYQAPHSPLISMPTLADLTWYKTQATGTITRAGSPIPGLTNPYDGSVVLDGNSGNTIKIDGVVVVTGDVILRGQIDGKGTLYVGRNLYLAGDVIYKSHYSPSPPQYVVGTDTPTTFYKSRLQPWLSANTAASCVTFCVSNNVVTADVTDKDWWDGINGIKYLVNLPDATTGRLFTDQHEDAGTDKIWGSDDPTEGDNNWTVQVDAGGGQTQTHTFAVSGKGTAATANTSGYTVIPGTGEDADGDGRYTAAFDDKAFKFGGDYKKYLGWPAGTSYKAFAGSLSSRNYPTHLDGFIFANHVVAGFFGSLSSTDIYLHGGIAQRGDATLSFAACINEHDPRINGMPQYLTSSGWVGSGQTLPGVPAVHRIGWQAGP